jgi:hypothetical protein
MRTIMLKMFLIVNECESPSSAILTLRYSDPFLVAFLDSPSAPFWIWSYFYTGLRNICQDNGTACSILPSPRSELDPLDAKAKVAKEPEGRGEPQPQENGEEQSTRNWQCPAWKPF